MKYIYLLIIVSFFTNTGLSQVFYTRTGHVHVSSDNSIKTIEADNYQVISIIDFETGDVKLEGLLKSFEFKLGALDRVFNSEKINVNQYPKFKFEGKLLRRKRIKLIENVPFEIEIRGYMYIWDEKRLTSAKGTFKKLADGRIEALSDFTIVIEEKNMHKLNDLIDQKIPSIINLSTESFGVSREINIDLDITYKKRNW